MSNSVKHTPIGGWTTARSERWDKKFWHKRFRIANKAYLSLRPKTKNVWILGWVDECGNEIWHNHTDELVNLKNEIYPHIRDVSDIWSMNKDGKSWQGTRYNHFYWWGGIYEEPIAPLFPQLGRKVLRKGGKRVKIKDIMKEMRK